MFVSLAFAWPQELKELFTSISLFNFNLQILAPEVRDPCTVLDGCALRDRVAIVRRCCSAP
jgi:hypothetical protein